MFKPTHVAGSVLVAISLAIPTLAQGQAVPRGSSGGSGGSGGGSSSSEPASQPAPQPSAPGRRPGAHSSSAQPARTGHPKRGAPLGHVARQNVRRRARPAASARGQAGAAVSGGRWAVDTRHRFEHGADAWRARHGRHRQATPAYTIPGSSGVPLNWDYSGLSSHLGFVSYYPYGGSYGFYGRSSLWYNPYGYDPYFGLYGYDPFYYGYAPYRPYGYGFYGGSYGSSYGRDRDDSDDRDEARMGSIRLRVSPESREGLHRRRSRRNRGRLRRTDEPPPHRGRVTRARVEGGRIPALLRAGQSGCREDPNRAGVAQEELGPQAAPQSVTTLALRE